MRSRGSHVVECHLLLVEENVVLWGRIFLYIFHTTGLVHYRYLHRITWREGTKGSHICYVFFL